MKLKLKVFSPSVGPGIRKSFTFEGVTIRIRRAVSKSDKTGKVDQIHLPSHMSINVVSRLQESTVG
jgi:hypothetical protein